MLFQGQTAQASALQAGNLGKLAAGHAAQCGMRVARRCCLSIFGVCQNCFLKVLCCRGVEPNSGAWGNHYHTA
jgi:hypothetical protein